MRTDRKGLAGIDSVVIDIIFVVFVFICYLRYGKKILIYSWNLYFNLLQRKTSSIHFLIGKLLVVFFLVFVYRTWVYYCASQIKYCVILFIRTYMYINNIIPWYDVPIHKITGYYHFLPILSICNYYYIMYVHRPTIIIILLNYLIQRYY